MSQNLIENTNFINLPMPLLTTAPSPSCWSLAWTFLTTNLGLSKGGAWSDSDMMIFLVEAETLKLLILIVGVFIFKNGQSLCMIALIKSVFLLLRCNVCVCFCPKPWTLCMYLYLTEYREFWKRKRGGL